MDTLADMLAFGASDAACYKWPEDTELDRACRAAFCEGAASSVAKIESDAKVIAALRKALKECTDDLATEVEARYSHGIKEHPAMTPKYNRDMASVYAARDLLATTGVIEQTAGEK